MLESELKRRVNRMIKAEFPEIWGYKTSDKFTAGIPDYLFCAWGVFAGVELKRPGEKPRKLQEHVMWQIRRAGGYAMWATTVDQVRQFLSDLKIHAKGGGNNGSRND